MAVSVEVTYVCDLCNKKKSYKNEHETGYVQSDHLINMQEFERFCDDWGYVDDTERDRYELLCDKCLENFYPENKYGVWLG